MTAAATAPDQSPASATSDLHSKARARPDGSPARARVAALIALCGVAAGLVYGGITAYECARDAFVAPTIVSPDSDVIVANKLRLGELSVERVRAAAEIEGIDADLAGADNAAGQLRDLQQTTTDALNWTSTITSQKAQQSAAELKALANQERVIVAMLDEQRKRTARAQSQVEAGLLASGELERQQQSQSQMELSLLENDRAVLQGQAVLQETSLVQQALAQRKGAPQMPEVLAQREQMIRLRLEIVRLESEGRAKRAQRKALVERVAKIDEMAAEIRNRPVFQAVEKSQPLAFVPYTQIDGVAPGADVYTCLWGLFFCRPVGSVSGLVPGEVILPDPWGAPARGQYAVLDLRDRESARAKTLRVRSWRRRPASTAAPEARVSAR